MSSQDQPSSAFQTEFVYKKMVLRKIFHLYLSKMVDDLFKVSEVVSLGAERVARVSVKTPALPLRSQVKGFVSECR